MAEEGLAVPEFGIEEVIRRGCREGDDERAPFLNGDGKGAAREERGGYGSLVSRSGSGVEEGKDINNSRDDGDRSSNEGNVGKSSALEGSPPVSRKRLITILCALWVCPR